MLHLAGDLLIVSFDLVSVLPALRLKDRPFLLCSTLCSPDKRDGRKAEEVGGERWKKGEEEEKEEEGVKKMRQHLTKGRKTIAGFVL